MKRKISPYNQEEDKGAAFTSLSPQNYTGNKSRKMYPNCTERIKISSQII